MPRLDEEPRGATAPRRDIEAVRLVRSPAEVSERRAAGGKAFALAQLRDAGVDTPPWFVVAPEAFFASLTPAQQARVERQGVGPETLAAIEPTQELRRQLAAALRGICPGGEPVAVRSSAVEEDSAVASFAGQLESFLDVAHGDVPSRVVDVWRSGFSARVREYRRQRGLGGEPQPPAVLVQRMVRAEQSGVAFSLDPVSGDGSVCVVSATRGLGDRLVGGEVEGDVYRVAKGGAVEVRAEKDAVLTAAAARAVAELAWRVAAACGCPQDIEWAFAGGRLFLLQARPITTLAPVDRGALLLWDNSNIVESYGGVTGPLTFSFVRHAYAGVYRQFLAALGVPARALAQHAVVLRNLLGLCRGRVYYNLLSWYRMLSLLPGFDRNRRFFDQMLGIRSRLPAGILAEVAPAAGGGRLRAAWGLLRSMLRIAGSWLRLQGNIRRCRRRVDDALAMPVERLRELRLDELAASYRELERRLLWNWQTPVLNDFFCMVCFGLSRHLLRKWWHAAGEALHAELLQRQGAIVSTEPARRIQELAALAKPDAALCRSLLQDDGNGWQAAIAANPAFAAAYADYMRRFGDRCLQELKLESPTLVDQPRPLLRAIGQLATAPATGATLATPAPPVGSVAARLPGKPLRRLLARWLLRQAKHRVRDRENLRFLRTRVYGRVRRLFVEMGDRLQKAGSLDATADVFFLELDELLGAIEGTATTQDLRGLVAVRRAEQQRWLQQPDPPDRFTTRGGFLTAVPQAVESAREAPTGEARRGLGCSPGRVRGVARVVRDPQDASLQPGEILIAQQTDPGWVMLFANAAGVVVERGSLLSHSAIVARELGIPAVVSVPGVTAWLRDGDVVELDGARGVVRRCGRQGDDD